MCIRSHRARHATAREAPSADAWFGRDGQGYDVYARTLRVHVLPVLGELRVSEFTPGRFDRFLSTVQVGITLVGFLRGDGCNVYTHTERIVLPD